jgi:hypothetical protein
MLPGVERYFRNFGGHQETYFAVSRTSRRFAPVWAAYRRRQQAGSGEVVARLRRLLRSGGDHPAG